MAVHNARVAQARVVSAIQRIVQCALLVTALGAGATAADSPEYELKAAFVARLAEFVEWPARGGGESLGDFTICLFGAHPIEAPLSELPALTRIKDRSVRVLRLVDPAAAVACDMLFIAPDEAPRLPEIRAILANKPVLTISDAPGLAQRGVMVNLITDSKRLRFEIQLREAQNAGLKISSRLLKLATVVE
jgi:hypothetical protein